MTIKTGGLIFVEGLNMKKICAKIVLKNLGGEQEMRRDFFRLSARQFKYPT